MIVMIYIFETKFVILVLNCIVTASNKYIEFLKSRLAIRVERPRPKCGSKPNFPRKMVSTISIAPLFIFHFCLAAIKSLLFFNWDNKESYLSFSTMTVVKFD
jgi:hypothetical protein